MSEIFECYVHDFGSTVHLHCPFCEAARLREQVAQLESFIESAPHSDECASVLRATHGHYDKSGEWVDYIRPCDCWKALADKEQSK